MKKAILMVLALAGFVVQNGAADGGGFADFRKQQQARLLAAIDSTLAAKAENAITGNFSAVKKAGVHLQSGLGGRKSGGAVNVIGAFAESDSHAFGWQLRAYAAEGGDKGGNVGLFYRQISGGILYGANAFLDYEDGDYGDFSRYGFGGELSHSIFALAANYYIPQTDDRKINATVAAFSREGYDAKLRLNAPGYREVKAAVDYYHFDGKGQTAKDAGWRYGLEFVPIPSFHFALYYDDGAETIGGDIGYSHTIGERQKRQSGEKFSPDLFAAVSREYSQRIATVAIVPDDIVHITPPVTTIMTMETELVMATRIASVQATTELYESAAVWFRFVSRARYLVTLPPAGASRPFVIPVTRNLQTPDNHPLLIAAGSAVQSNIGNFQAFPPQVRLWMLTVVEGSEVFISVTTTLTTRTTTTMAAVTITTLPPANTNTSIVIMTMRTTTAITAAAITTTARMTAAEVRTTTTTETPTLTATRMANVHFTARYDFTIFVRAISITSWILVTSIYKHAITLPDMAVSRPWVVSITGSLDRRSGDDFRVIDSLDNGHTYSRNQIWDYGAPRGGHSPFMRHTLTVAENSEEIISINTTLTNRTSTTMAAITTATTMTMAAVSTTTRITTFSTMFITLTANAAMGDIPPPLDSRLRGNDDIKACYSRNSGNSLYVIALKGHPVHSTGQRPVTALPINQALKGRPILLQGKARQKHKHNPPPV